MKNFPKLFFYPVACLILFGSVALAPAQPLPQRQIREIEGLVRVQDMDPSIILDLRYATENNFTRKKIYPVSVCALRKETAQKLAAANAEFKKGGYRIKIWDAYRPPYVQKIFWDLVHDDRYVADPHKGGSKHNRGGAVDLTLVDSTGQEIEMPSGFDDFSEKASPNNPSMSAQARKNVDYLSQVMVKHGFVPYEHEWWHFDDSDWRNFLLVDVQLERFLDDSPPVLQTLDKSIAQAIVVEERSPGFSAQLSTWERWNDRWLPVLEPMAAVIGKNGFAQQGQKEEGDGRTPFGIYKLGKAFGYAAAKTKLPFRQATENDFWVDDPESAQYNQWVTGTPQAKSFERLKRDDDLYKYGIVIEYNTDPRITGKGSAIFIHVWRGPDSPTAGCVAISEENLLSLLEWLDPSRDPTIILGQSN